MFACLVFLLMVSPAPINIIASNANVIEELDIVAIFVYAPHNFHGLLYRIIVIGQYSTCEKTALFLRRVPC